MRLVLGNSIQVEPVMAKCTNGEDVESDVDRPSYQNIPRTEKTVVTRNKDKIEKDVSRPNYQNITGRNRAVRRRNWKSGESDHCTQLPVYSSLHFGDGEHIYATLATPTTHRAMRCESNIYESIPDKLEWIEKANLEEKCPTLDVKCAETSAYDSKSVQLEESVESGMYHGHNGDYESIRRVDRYSDIRSVRTKTEKTEETGVYESIRPVNACRSSFDSENYISMSERAPLCTQDSYLSPTDYPSPWCLSLGPHVTPGTRTDTDTDDGYVSISGDTIISGGGDPIYEDLSSYSDQHIYQVGIVFSDNQRNGALSRTSFARKAFKRK